MSDKSIDELLREADGACTSEWEIICLREAITKLQNTPPAIGEEEIWAVILKRLRLRLRGPEGGAVIFEHEAPEFARAVLAVINSKRD